MIRELLTIVQGEYYKLFKGKVISILILILILLTPITAVFYTNYTELPVVPTGGLDWKDNVKQEIDMYAGKKYDASKDPVIEKKQDAFKVGLLKYRLENNIDNNSWKLFVVNDLSALNETYLYENNSETLNKINNLYKLIENNDWKAYLLLKNIDLKSTLEYEGRDEERNVLIEENLYRIKYGVEPSNYDSNWKNKLLQENQQNNISLINSEKYPYEKGFALSEVEAVKLQNKVIENTYRIENNIKPIEEKTFAYFFINSNKLIYFIYFVVIILSGTIIAREFQKSTVKMLLISPYKRWKILSGKYITLLSISLFLLLVTYLGAVISGFLVYRGEFDVPIVLIKDNYALEINMFIFVAVQYLLNCFPLIFIISLTSMVSIFLKKSSISIAIGAFVIYTSKEIVGFLIKSMDKISILKYIPFTHLDLYSHFTNNFILRDVSLIFSIGILLIYSVIMILTTFDYFKEIDI